jgi:Ca2+-binding RTX toxin-like protein
MAAARGARSSVCVSMASLVASLTLWGQIGLAPGRPLVSTGIDGKPKVNGEIGSGNQVRCFGVEGAFGDAGPNIFQGTPGDDVFSGLGGDDSLTGDGAGNDRLCGGQGNDYLRGYSGNDLLSGGPGDDLINAGPGEDLIIGGARLRHMHRGGEERRLRTHSRRR